MSGVSRTELESAVSEHDGTIRITCRVQPRASRGALAGMVGDALKVALTAPPVEGKANAALCLFLARKLHCSRSAVSIVSGTTARNKIVEIQGLSRSAVLELLAER